LTCPKLLRFCKQGIIVWQAEGRRKRREINLTNYKYLKILTSGFSGVRPEVINLYLNNIKVLEKISIAF
jgi:hypothetical protein